MPSDPTGSYNIDLTNSLERAVLLDALDAVAIHQSFVIQNLEYECVEGSEYWETITLNKIDELRVIEHFDANEHAELDNLVNLIRILTESQFLNKLKSKFTVSYFFLYQRHYLINETFVFFKLIFVKLIFNAVICYATYNGLP